MEGLLSHPLAEEGGSDTAAVVMFVFPQIAASYRVLTSQWCGF